MIGVLGAGPHGREIARCLRARTEVRLFDDNLDDYPPLADWGGPYVIGAAWPRVRQQIAAKTRLGQPWHDGIVQFPGARVSAEARLGAHTHVGYNAVVSHGCQLGEYVTVCAGAVLGGDVTVGDGVFIGVNVSVIHGGIIIGVGATVGAGAVVTRDVWPGETVAGVPAKAVLKRRPWLA